MTFRAQRAARRGIVMIDAMVYLAVIGVVLILAAAVFDKGMRESAGLQRNISDIERALNAGERWRADVRMATGPIQLDPQLERVLFVIPRGTERIIYEMFSDKVRRIGTSRETTFTLNGVAKSEMMEERRGNVVGWRWELELEHRRKEARVRPLFTFMAVPEKTR